MEADCDKELQTGRYKKEKESPIHFAGDPSCQEDYKAVKAMHSCLVYNLNVRWIIAMKTHALPRVVGAAIY